jgi:hypothetical protein
VNFILELAFRFLLLIVAEIVVRIAANAAFFLFHFFVSTGDFLMDLVTLDYFRDHSKVPLLKKPSHPVPDWASALLGLCFWCEFAAAAYLTWPWLSSL